ncbi:MAG: tRNA/rRNA methyltransferase [Prolixibacteraceae bacterium]|nr:tRNA/rRNA methyltransferase [Prolixibacteraceae bacterium]
MIFNFLLIEPSVPENVGAAARAIKTMGFARLRLIKPCNYLCDEARWLAHGSNDILDQALVFDTLDEAIADLDFIVATTAKKRSVKEDYIPANQLYKIIENKNGTVQNVGVLFGREEYGLLNEELKKCHAVTSVPLTNPYPSLNLAQAVMIYAYELSGMINLPQTQRITNQNSFNMLTKNVKHILKHIGMKEDSSIFPRIIERLSLLADNDIHLLHSVCNKINEKYRVY